MKPTNKGNFSMQSALAKSVEALNDMPTNEQLEQEQKKVQHQRYQRQARLKSLTINAYTTFIGEFALNLVQSDVVLNALWQDYNKTQNNKGLVELHRYARKVMESNPLNVKREEIPKMLLYYIELHEKAKEETTL